MAGTDPNHERSAAYNRGRRAARNETPTNPYRPGSRKHGWWQAGFDSVGGGQLHESASARQQDAVRGSQALLRAVLSYGVVHGGVGCLSGAQCRVRLGA